MENPMERENLEDVVSGYQRRGGLRQNYVDSDDDSIVQVPAGSVKSLAEVTAALDLKVTRMMNITPEFNTEGPFV